MSNDVAWQVLRRHNSHLVKRDGHMLSGEPGNLLNLHSYKFSGLANRKLVHVAAGKDKKPHLTILKSAAPSTQPPPPRELSTGSGRSHARHRRAVSDTRVTADAALTSSLRCPLLLSAVCVCVCRARTARDHMKRTVTPLLKHRRDRAVRAAHVINNATALSHHRPDLTHYAIARYHALHRASNVKEGTGVNVKRRRVPAKERKAKKAATA